VLRVCSVPLFIVAHEGRNAMQMEERLTFYAIANVNSSYASALGTDSSDLDLVILPALQDQDQEMNAPGRYQDLYVLKTLFQRCKASIILECTQSLYFQGWLAFGSS